MSESSSTTTSLPISTRRFARSITSSATVMWFSVGMSKVEDTTSPLMERCMSVTSSGRSSTRRQMRCTSGLFAEMAAAMSLSTVVLPAFGGRHDETALTFADRRGQVDDAGGDGVLAMLHGEALVRIHRRQIPEARSAFKLLERQAVHRDDLLNGGELLVLARGAGLSDDEVALCAGRCGG